jgi:hypothetical protein
MTWTPLLLSDPSPCLRWLVLRHLLHFPENHPEVMELSELRKSDPMFMEILSLQEADGSWKPFAFSDGRAGGNRILSTSFALSRLGYLGFDQRHPAVKRGAAYLFAQQRKDGSWPLPVEVKLSEEGEEVSSREGYSRMPLQTAFPLRGLAACGYASDQRAENAYEWLLTQRLEDGAWPTGVASEVYGYVAGYRRIAHSRWGCRSNTTGALICLSLHSQRRHSPEARRALDLLLGRETQEESTLGYEVARLVGAERPHGFITFFARYDPALLLNLCSHIGVSLDDERLTRLVGFVRSLQGEYGLWEYARRPQISRWLTFDLLHSLSSLDSQGDWLNLEPRTPFQAYPRRQKRF